ncbi:MAG: CoB--CoM heterodisulfide reductase iron-sulfur subunit B family protein [Candidatus Latescibacteria bacterium]|nr:CoB--CoM heterodisulfide reductase iron-sulfur subunit B family protein [Candidatus Latescibacterota bacterium]
MKQIAYYPGCTLYTKSKNLDLCARETAQILGVELKELETWNCCGAIYSTVQDDLANQVAPIRNLIEAQKISNKLVTLCAACYNVLKRSNHNLFLPENDIYRRRMMNFLDTEYDGKTETVHYLEVLKNDIGFENLKTKVKTNLDGLKVASYYGCLMLRPSDELNFDDPDNPTMMDDMFAALGAEPVEFPFKGECCGGYVLVDKPDVATRCSQTILESIVDAGADCVATTCPLCQYNIDNQQKLMSKQFNLPVFYFTQLLGLALNVDQKILNLDNHYIDPKPLLKQKGLLK